MENKHLYLIIAVLGAAAISILAVFVVLGIIFVAFFGWFQIGYMIEDGVFEDYTGWKEVEIPTDSELKARVKIPEEWYFVVEDGKVYLKDDSGNVIATEVFAGWLECYSKNGIHYDNFDENDINSELPLKFQDRHNFELVNGSEHGCYLKAIEVDEIVYYALNFEVMRDEEHEGFYTLFLIFDSEIKDIDTFDKIQKSYRNVYHT